MAAPMTWIAFIRGINVGGHRKVEMARLRTELAAVGFDDFATYIQSGNVVVTSDRSGPEVSRQIEAVLLQKFQCDVPVAVLSLAHLEQALASNPYGGDPSRIIFFFALELLPEGMDTSVVNGLLANGEEITFTPSVIYLNAPEGIGRSKIAERLPRLVPVELTARNLRTVQKVVEMGRAGG